MAIPGKLLSAGLPDEIFISADINLMFHKYYKYILFSNLLTSNKTRIKGFINLECNYITII